MRHFNGTYLFIGFFLAIINSMPLMGMEEKLINPAPSEDHPGMHRPWTNENEPLLDGIDSQEHLNQLKEIVIDDAAYPRPFFDGSRRFYDDEARLKAKKRACKQCMKFTISFSIGINLLPYIGYFLAAIITQTSLSEVASKLPSWYFWGTPCITVPLIAIGSWSDYVPPAINERNPFDPETKYCCKKKCFTKQLDKMEISQEILDHLDEVTTYAQGKKSVQLLAQNMRLHCESHKLWKLRRKIFSTHKKNNELIHTIEERLTKPNALRNEYRKVAFRVKEILKNELGKDMVRYIFNLFPENNILKQMIPRKCQWACSEERIDLTEKEFLQLHLNQGSPVTYLSNSLLSWYWKASILAEHGWIALEPSEKYPIRCRIYYFDEEILSGIYERYYASELKPPFTYFPFSAYFPYSPELAECYKFEEDPYYTKEFMAPSNGKIKRLLALRQEIVAQQNENGRLMQLGAHNTI